MRIRGLIPASVAVACMACATEASTLLINGSFETGDFTGWTTAVASGSSGNISVTTGGTAPFSGAAIDSPTDGTFYAVTDQSGSGAYALTQSFLASAQMLLSFDFFAQSSEVLFDAGDLSHTGLPNQHARVDILTGTAGAFDMGAAIVESLVAPIVSTPPDPFTS